MSHSINAKEYFDIVNLLSVKTENDFSEYRKKVHEKKGTFDINSVIEELQKYSLENIQQDDTLYYRSLQRVHNWLFGCTIVFAIFLSFLFIGNSIDINLFLLKAIVIPFCFMLVSWIGIIRYKYPRKKVDSILIKILNKIPSIKFDNKYYHIYKAYFVQVFQIAGILFSLTILVCTILLLLFTSISYSYETTIIDILWEQKIIALFAMPWSWAMPTFVPDLELIKIAFLGDDAFIKNTPQRVWAVFQIMSILTWIVIPRIIVWFLAKKVLANVLYNSLEVQGEVFFKSIFKKSEYSKVEKVEIVEKEKEQSTVAPNVANISYKDFYKIYYELTVEESQNIDFVYDDRNLDKKTFESFTLGNFEEEDQDEVTLEKLGNLVLVFVSPSSLPDESFKDQLKKILTNENVQQIWVAPLIQIEEKKYRLANRRDEEYSEWKYQINLILANQKVKLYNER